MGGFVYDFYPWERMWYLPWVSAANKWQIWYSNEYIYINVCLHTCLVIMRCCFSGYAAILSICSPGTLHVLKLCLKLKIVEFYLNLRSMIIYILHINCNGNRIENNYNIYDFFHSSFDRRKSQICPEHFLKLIQL